MSTPFPEVKGSPERTGEGVLSARARLYAALMDVKQRDAEVILSWVSRGVPVQVTDTMRTFEDAVINFARVKIHARNKRDRWKARKRLQGVRK